MPIVGRTLTLYGKLRRKMALGKKQLRIWLQKELIISHPSSRRILKPQ